MCTYSYWICARTLDYPELIIRGHASRLPTLPPRDNRPFRIFEIHRQPSYLRCFCLDTFRLGSVVRFDAAVVSHDPRASDVEAPFENNKIQEKTCGMFVRQQKKCSVLDI